MTATPESERELSESLTALAAHTEDDHVERVCLGAAAAIERLAEERDALSAQVDELHRISLDVMRERDALRERAEALDAVAKWLQADIDDPFRRVGLFGGADFTVTCRVVLRPEIEGRADTLASAIRAALKNAEPHVGSEKEG